MIAISTISFLEACSKIQAAAPAYKLGRSGDDGYCDCIGLIIGAIKRSGGAWPGIHGSNYAARNEMTSFGPISSAATLTPGMAVFKGRAPGASGYSLPDRYKNGTDLTDYYHVGVVVSVAPLRIMHCTSWTGGSGIRVDTVLGKWAYAGRLKRVTYDGQEGGDTEMDTDTTVTEEAAESDYLRDMKVTGAGEKGLRFRQGPAKDQPFCKKNATIPEGTWLKVTEIKGDYAKATYNGETGWVSTDFLQVDGSYEPLYTVTIPRLGEASAEELLAKYPGSTKAIQAG